MKKQCSRPGLHGITEDKVGLSVMSPRYAIFTVGGGVYQ